MVYTLSQSPIGEMDLVRSIVPIHATDGDFSNEVASAERRLTSLGYTCYGSFLETDPAAKLVNLDACRLIK
jgi:hypothetical protein